ncbi:MAG TPA: type II secretion system protein M [Steroidobacteraceae bacterium]|nr:type II secretion system protein M [Steroidobacteraceae bacterium]
MKLTAESLSFESILQWFGALSAREQRIVQIGALLAPVLFVFGVLLPLDRSVAQAHERLLKKRNDLAWMQGVAPELAASPQPPSTSGESLLVIVDRSARESGLAGSLAGSEPAGPGALSLRLQKAPFDTLIAWLARLAQQNGIRVDSASVDSAGAPGLVNAAVVLHTG